jgi:hypothetical protein
MVVDEGENGAIERRFEGWVATTGGRRSGRFVRAKFARILSGKGRISGR